MKSLLFTAASALSMSSTALAVGSAIIENKCSYPVYMWHISSEKTDSSPTVLKAGSGTYSEEFVECSSGGVSLKLSKSNQMGGDDITQYEYTLVPNMVFYDISNVNCAGSKCPFQAGGMSLKPSADCAAVTCKGGIETCHEVYNLFNDDWASHGCATSTDLTLTLCSDDSGSSSGDSAGYIGGSSSSAAPVSTSSSTTKAKPKPKPTSSSSAVKIAAVETTSTSSTPSSTPTPTPTPTPSKPSTTLATSTKKKTKHVVKPTTTAPPAAFYEGPATSWVTEVAVETAYSTVVVTVRDAGHEEYHKHKARHAPHLHARRHQHQ